MRRYLWLYFGRPRIIHSRPPPTAHRKASMPLGKVAGVQQAPGWYSPSAANWTTRDADLELIRFLHERECWSKAKFSWLGELCAAGHSLLLKHPELTEGRWVFAMHQWRSSCVLGFVAKEVAMPGSALRGFEHDLSEQPRFLSVVETTGWVALHFKWRSPAWQLKHCPRASGLPICLRAFPAEPNEGEDTLLRVCAKQAFFGLGKTWLVKMAQLRVLSLPGSMSLFDMLYSVVSSVLETTGDGTMVYLNRRLAQFAQQERFSEEFAELDEAVELLEVQDQKKVKDEKKTRETMRDQEANFRQEYVKRKKELRESGKGGGGRSKRKAKVIRIPPFPDHDISLELARSLAPPSSSLWMSRAEGNWQGHYKPFPRVSRSWNRWGEAGALTQVLRELWDRHCQSTGMSRDETGVVGLWDADPSVDSVAASSRGAT